MKFSHFTKNIYIDLLPIFVAYSTLLGFMAGLSSKSGGDKTPFDSFANTIGFTSIGVITGVMFPISYPLLAGYVLYKNSK